MDANEKSDPASGTNRTTVERASEPLDPRLPLD